MSSTIALKELFKAGFEDFVIPSYETAPYTTIQNRAQVTRSLKAIAGVERIHVKGLNRLSNEFGPNGEQVFEADNKDSRIRFVGSGWEATSDTNSSRPLTISTADYVEVTFYGTGLNWLTNFFTSMDVRASVDGGIEGSNLFSATTSTILNARNYASNIRIPVTSGLSLGWHTVKLRNNNAAGLNFFGFEVLNERSNLAVYSGSGISNGSFNGLSSLTTSAFNDGVVGTKGARVVKYIENGTLKTSVQEVDSSAQYLTSANHANEEVVRRINFREFGANRADDFSTLTSTASSRAFTLDDGTTTLVVNTGIAAVLAGDIESLRASGAGAFYTITFVGTGLDIYSPTNDASARTTDIFIDGVSAGNISTPSNQSGRLVKICSGLPYGTHTVKFLRNTNDTIFVSDFIIYQPKKPSIPAGCLEVADYNVMASFVANSTAGLDTISTGVLRKMNTREFTYTGTFTATLDPAQNIGGFSIASATAGNKITYYFFGTGLGIRPGASASNTFTIAINGSTDLSSLTTSVYGANIALTASTGTVVQSVTAQVGQGISITGLTLGFHKVEITKVSGVGGISATFDIITPIHINNSTLKIGNQSLKSVTKYSPEKSVSNAGPDLSKAKAWLFFDAANSKIFSSMNVSAVLNIGTGGWKVFFEKPFKSDTSFVIVGMCESNEIQYDRTPTYPRGGNSIEIYTSLNGTYSSTYSFNIVCFGELIDE